MVRLEVQFLNRWHAAGFENLVKMRFLREGRTEGGTEERE